jgi:hypothetical protein
LRELVHRIGDATAAKLIDWATKIIGFLAAMFA